MTRNRLNNRCVIFALILIVGLGLAFALPWLANAQSLAAEGVPDEQPDYAEVVHNAELAYALAVEGNGNAPISLDLCFATHNDGTDVFSELDASAVQEAVDAASSGDTVKVAGTCIGVVARDGLLQTVYISKSLNLEGGHTQSDWTMAPDPDTYTTTLYAINLGRVIVISGTIDVSLDSLFISGGLADNDTLYNYGGGIWSNSALTLTNSIVYSNTADQGGGMSNLGISPVLTNVTFSGNSSGGEGGAMYNDGRRGESSPILTNVTFSGNSADNGGAMCNDGRQGESIPILSNVTFSGNSAEGEGGAMYNDGRRGESSPILTNVTFSGNSAEGDGGGMYNNGLGGNSSPDVYNSIMWNNRDSSGTGTISATIFLTGTATTTMTHSIVQDSLTGGSWIGGSYLDGGGNLDADPLFILDIDPSTAPTTTGNLRLHPGSPAIDAGDNAYVTGVLTDLDGEPRVIDGNLDGTETVDMGAYETRIYYYLPLIYR